MADSDDIMKQLNSLMQTTATAAVVTQLMVAYDGFATAALRELLADDASMAEATKGCEWLAAKAWEIADAMMLERAKRGLGNPQGGK